MTNRIVKTLNIGVPLTSLAFSDDGHTIVVGTLYGINMICMFSYLFIYMNIFIYENINKYILFIHKFSNS